MGIIGDGKIGRNKIDAKFLAGPTVLYFRGRGMECFKSLFGFKTG
jgi:hypothetical protein